MISSSMDDVLASHSKSHRIVQSTSDLMKCCYSEFALEDRISALPDDILISIISNLKLREAARTSILSHRWRFIWTNTTGVLDFVKSVPFHDKLQGNNLKAERCRYLEWVNMVLCLHRAPTIDEFRVCINYGIENSDVVDSWIKFALEKHAKRLILDLGCRDFFKTYHQYYALTTKVFSNCNSTSLTTLHLESLEVTGEVLGYMLSCFRLLQVLHLYDIDSLVELKIAGPLHNLTCLEIKNCYSMHYLEVRAVNLVSFVYRGPLINEIFMEVPRLVVADVNDAFLVKNIHQFSSCFSRLESLSLRLPQYLEWMHEDFPRLPKFIKLRWLNVSLTIKNVNDCLSHCTKLLKASPSLQKLVLEMNIEEKIKGDEVKMRRRKATYQHKQLKVIELINFRGFAKDTELVQRLLVKLSSLEKIVINQNPQPESPYWDYFHGPFDSEKAIATAQILQNSCSPAAELVIVGQLGGNELDDQKPTP